MQINVKINGVDFARWATENGITQYPILRQTRSVEVLNGDLHKASVEKRGITISLITMRDSSLSSLISAITPKSTVEYTDLTRGARTSTFYVTVSNAVAQKVVGGNTYYSGVTIELEEM